MGGGTRQGERAAVCRSAENDSSPERAAGRPAGGGVEVGQAWESVGEQHRLGVTNVSRSEDYYVEGLSLK